MKKFFLGGFILLDLSFIGGSALVLYTHLQPFKPSFSLPFSAKSSRHAAAPTPASPGAASSTPAKAAVTNGSIPAAGADSTSRKILFSYRNPHVKQVSIRADFTGWKAELMQKGANGSWTYQAVLSPGEYAYCFTADDKTFKDPANKRTKQIGRTPVSAILVEALPTKSPK